jgi:hypothetical protein
MTEPELNTVGEDTVPLARGKSLRPHESSYESRLSSKMSMTAESGAASSIAHRATHMPDPSTADSAAQKLNTKTATIISRALARPSILDSAAHIALANLGCP